VTISKAWELGTSSMEAGVEVRRATQPDRQAHTKDTNQEG
jgi:hypothetical protein